MNLRQVGEDRLLEQLLPTLRIRKNVIAGAGDDCAVVRPPSRTGLLLLKTDCVVEKIHFDPSAAPVAIGWKAMMRPLSDFAAVSGVPQFALVTLILPASKSTSWVKKLYRGLERAAARFDVSIVGGETSSSRGPAVISVSVSGFVEKKRYVSRAGGKIGDVLFVTGELGGSNRGKHLRFTPRIEQARWLTKNFRIHAMMDLSDGLGADLPRLARASKLGFHVDVDKLPLNPGCRIDNAMADGEDYELLFAISPRQQNQLLTAWRKEFPRIRLTLIGELNRRSKSRNPKLSRGYIHFK